MNADEALAHAVAASLESPCLSKRGVAIFAIGGLIATGYNAPPAPWRCSANADCKRTCRHTAIHAEMAALLEAGRSARGAQMLHVKTVDGAPVPSGSPSCVACSKTILAAGIARMWLLHEDGLRAYGAEEFHRLSLADDMSHTGVDRCSMP